jgi:hypothetical protein
MPTAAYFNNIPSHIPAAYRGDRDFVDETVAIARQAVEEYYDAAVVAHGGDTVRAAQLRDQHAADIRELAINISILRRGEGVEEGASALRTVLSSLERMGYTGGRVGLHEWLGNLLEDNERNNAVLRSAGFDVTRIRRETSRPQDDIQALIALLREQVDLLRSQVQLLSEDELGAQGPTNEAAARAVTGGAAATTTTRTVDAPNDAPAGAVRVTDLAPNLIGRTR